MAALLLFLLAGCQGQQAPVTWASIWHAEDEGNRDTRYREVVELSSGCSGTLVAPDRVLTAAHCVVGELHGLPDVHISPNGSGNPHVFPVASCAIHPGAYDGAGACLSDRDGSVEHRHDIAVLHLADDVPEVLASPTPPMLRDRLRARGRDWEHRSLLLIGWHRWPLASGQARRYRGTHRILGIRNGLLTTAPPDEVSLDERFRVHHGNSGGPAIFRDGAREWLVGVLSSGSGGGDLGSPFAVYATTFERRNARFLHGQLR